jgi:hypothetical protein
VALAAAACAQPRPYHTLTSEPVPRVGELVLPVAIDIDGSNVRWRCTYDVADHRRCGPAWPDAQLCGSAPRTAAVVACESQLLSLGSWDAVGKPVSEPLTSRLVRASTLVE